MTAQNKIIACIEILVGFTYVVSLISYIPIVGSAIGRALSTIIGFAGYIPFYTLILAILGAILFIDGIIRFKKNDV